MARRQIQSVKSMPNARLLYTASLCAYSLDHHGGPLLAAHLGTIVELAGVHMDLQEVRRRRRGRDGEVHAIGARLLAAASRRGPGDSGVGDDRDIGGRLEVALLIREVWARGKFEYVGPRG